MTEQERPYNNNKNTERGEGETKFNEGKMRGL